MEKNISAGCMDINDLEDELGKKRTELEDMNNFEAQGAYIRSRAGYKMEGERPTKMFCALEIYNGTLKYVPQLIIKDENNQEKIVTSQSEVENQILKFYSHLYEKKDVNITIESIEDVVVQNPHQRRKT